MQISIPNKTIALSPQSVTNKNNNIAATSSSQQLTSTATSATNNYGSYNGLTVAWLVEHGSQNIQQNLYRMDALADKASNECSIDERSLLQREFQALGKEIDDIASNVNYDNVPLLNGQLEQFSIQLTNRHHETVTEQLPMFDGTMKGLQLEQTQLDSADNAVNTKTAIAKAMGRIQHSLALLELSKQAIQANVGSISLKA